MTSFLPLLELAKLILEALTVLFLSALSLVVIRAILSRRAKHRVLASIPGPPPSEFATGNLKELYHPDGALYTSLRQYGSVVKVHGLFGVSCFHHKGPEYTWE